MYPNLYYVFNDWFGVKWNPLKYISSFGVFMALGFLVAILLLKWELTRKAREGLVFYEEEKLIVGKPPNPINLLINFLFGFIFGYKFFGILFSNASRSEDYILSLSGNWLAGLLSGLLITGLKWYDVNRQRLSTPEERTVKIWPADRVGAIAVLGMIFGLGGAKIFNSLENWGDFIHDPLRSLFSFSGLTFYGGLICAALAIWWYCKKHHIPFWQLNDAAAPALMLSYAVGRIGCQVSGDGDWGIPNSAYMATPDGKVIPAGIDQFYLTVRQNPEYFTDVFGSLGRIRHLGLKAPSFLPDWLFAFTYPHNVNDIGLPLSNCTGAHCAYLPVPVFPTSLYETILGTVIFFVLWALRKRLRVPGMLFSIYLVFNGIERFFIEKIRVNSTYDLFGLRPSQAELISLALVILGSVSFFLLRKRGNTSL
jgi:phosphatidylglycerol:prolipoprotein diacylglycerol transferase